MSVVFDFNASLSDDAPDCQILNPVDLMILEKSGLEMVTICVVSFAFNHSD